MKKSIYTLIDWLLPKKILGDFYQVRIGRILTIIHISLFLMTVFMTVTTFFIHPENGGVPLVFSGIGLVCLIFVFKKWGNFVVSGNLLALVIALTLIPPIFETGGLFSDNLLWLSIVPLLSLLFANRISAVIWSLLLVAFAGYLTYLENVALVSYRIQIAEFPASYFFASYALLFFVVLGIVWVFAKGQEDIIKNLRGKQLVLKQQKRDLTMQASVLKRAQKKLKESNEELEQFAYAASHDLKEPLRMIKAFTQLIEKKADKEWQNSPTEFFSFVTGGVERMEKLLSDLLNYSRLGAEKPASEIDLNIVLVDVVTNLMQNMQETKTIIETNELPTIKSNSTEMTQLFQNLISNSIKFRREEIKPEIKISSVRENGHYLISITDNGIGIEAQYQQKVFRIFERLNTKKDSDGTGIGLATCKKIVDKIGGKIWVNSTFKQGTTFHFTIPNEKIASINN